MDNMKEEALRRAREMQSKGSYHFEPNRTVRNTQPPAEKIQDETAQHPEKSTKENSEPQSLKASNLFEDKEKLLILILLLLLSSEENCDPVIILTLLYLII